MVKRAMFLVFRITPFPPGWFSLLFNSNMVAVGREDTARRAYPKTVVDKFIFFLIQQCGLCIC